jgi:hypothetical protein
MLSRWSTSNLFSNRSLTILTDKIGCSALHAVCSTHSVYGYEGHRDVAELLISQHLYDLFHKQEKNGVLFKLSHWSTTHLFLSNISTSATFPL